MTAGCLGSSIPLTLVLSIEGVLRILWAVVDAGGWVEVRQAVEAGEIQQGCVEGAFAVYELVDMFQQMRRGGYLFKDLDIYLMSRKINGPEESPVCLVNTSTYDRCSFASAIHT